MKKREERSPKIKALNTICTSVLFCSLVYMLVAGMNIVALGIVVSSVVGMAAPVMLSGEGVLDILTGFFEAVFEGMAVIVEGIAGFLSGLFS